MERTEQVTLTRMEPGDKGKFSEDKKTFYLNI